MVTVLTFKFNKNFKVSQEHNLINSYKIVQIVYSNIHSGSITAKQFLPCNRYLKRDLNLGPTSLHLNLKHGELEHSPTLASLQLLFKNKEF